jgi:hypothetical protein
MAQEINNENQIRVRIKLIISCFSEAISIFREELCRVAKIDIAQTECGLELHK